MAKNGSCTFKTTKAVFTVTVLLLLVMKQEALGSGLSNFVFRVEFVSYRNPSSQIGSGQPRCCSLFGCDNDCENIFTFCLRPVGTDVEMTDANCPLGRFQTEVVSGGDNIQFVRGLTEGFNNPNPLTFNTQNRNVQLIIRTRSDNLGRQDALIDRFVVSLELQSDLSNVTTIAGELGVGSIMLGLQAVCAENYFGDACDILCIRRNDTFGNYSCGNQPNDICPPGFVNPDANCIVNSTIEPIAASTIADRIDSGSTSVIGVAVGCVVAVILLVATAVVISVMISTMLLSREKRKTFRKKFLFCRKGIPSEEEQSIKISTTVLGDNPTYGDLSDETSSSKSSNSGPHYENTPSSSTVALAQTDEQTERSLTFTGSHSYEYVTNRAVKGYKLNRVQEQVKVQNDLQASTGSSVTYYSIEYTQTLMANQRHSVQNELPSNSIVLPQRGNSGLPISERYETMETYNSTLQEGQQSNQVQNTEVDPRSHYEFES